MLCENCSIEHSGDYGSGRFCSSLCARSFSTKNKRSEINNKVSNTLKGRPKSLEEKIKRRKYQWLQIRCKKCGEIFTAKSEKIALRALCSEHSRSGFKHKPGSKSGGLRENSGKCNQLIYHSKAGIKLKLNSEEIKIAKILDSLDLNWERNWRGFNYITIENIERKFYPDFYLKDYDVYLEYKGWVTEEMTHKMKDAQQRNKNLKLLIIYGVDKRYRNLGLNYEEIEKNNNVLLENISAWQKGMQQSPKL